MILLNEACIRQHLSNYEINHLMEPHVLTSVDSTNRYLKDLPPSNMIDLCCTELQTKGRGRLGRDWYSPFAENIYCSSRWSISKNAFHLSALSLIVGLAVLATLDEFKLKDDIFIKWPNDLIWNGKKLCGILVELVPHLDNNFSVIVGIGLNVNSDSQNPSIQSKLDRPWCSLFEITGVKWDRNKLIATLMFHLNHHITQFTNSGFRGFRSRWEKQDYLYEKFITIRQPSGSICGLAKGVTDEGQLKVLNENGDLRIISSGEASLSCL